MRDKNLQYIDQWKREKGLQDPDNPNKPKMLAQDRVYIDAADGLYGPDVSHQTLDLIANDLTQRFEEMTPVELRDEKYRILGRVLVGIIHGPRPQSIDIRGVSGPNMGRSQPEL